ncbi:unnamed protein product (plasmid) [Mycetohabitans rhizoxinica HKI 454]|uniref:Uncharacterized protein n=1 Tax=Mycetohabitans rhizoxinica (strain DSM 19002 / CIP 109453 / HKI 454) TaxID=882378 RepID=E5AVC9_MYCRK|nr:unnamed protein product [Mycetohabitans rhizoxinica HKI 454]
MAPRRLTTTNSEDFGWKRLLNASTHRPDAGHQTGSGAWPIRNPYKISSRAFHQTGFDSRPGRLHRLQLGHKRKVPVAALRRAVTFSPAHKR